MLHMQERKCFIRMPYGHLLDYADKTDRRLRTVPVPSSDSALTAKFCEASAHYSKENSFPHFYETPLQEKVSRGDRRKRSSYRL